MVEEWRRTKTRVRGSNGSSSWDDGDDELVCPLLSNRREGQTN